MLNDVETLRTLRCLDPTGDDIASSSQILVLRPVSHFEHSLCPSLGYCVSDNRSRFSKRVDLP
jgi:hypothetical protein